MLNSGFYFLPKVSLILFSFASLKLILFSVFLKNLDSYIFNNSYFWDEVIFSPFIGTGREIDFWVVKSYVVGVGDILVWILSLIHSDPLPNGTEPVFHEILLYLFVSIPTFYSIETVYKCLFRVYGKEFRIDSSIA